jgi:hypothetical protein
MFIQCQILVHEYPDLICEDGIWIKRGEKWCKGNKNDRRNPSVVLLIMPASLSTRGHLYYCINSWSLYMYFYIGCRVRYSTVCHLP